MVKPTASKGTLLGTVAAVIAAIVLVPLLLLVVFVSAVGSVDRAANPAPSRSPRPSASVPWTNPTTPSTTTEGSTGSPFQPWNEAPTATPEPTETKPGPATCEAAAAGLAKAITPTGTNAQWRGRMAPLVTGEIERALPTVDVTAIPTGTPKVSEVWEQKGACDATLEWKTSRWAVVFINQGHGWVASEWSAA